jgi:hypothetical protein
MTVYSYLVPHTAIILNIGLSVSATRLPVVRLRTCDKFSFFFFFQCWAWFTLGEWPLNHPLEPVTSFLKARW